MDDLRLVYVTCPDRGLARAIAQALVDERLAACVNLLPGMESCYRWQGAVETAEEVVLIAKTRADRADAVVARVRALHRATVPCAIVLPIVGGNPDFLTWMRTETSDG